MRGGGNARGRGGGRPGGNRPSAPIGPPEKVEVAGEMIQVCKEQIVVKATMDSKVPYNNGRVFLNNKTEIGRVDEIMGPVSDYMFSVTLLNGVKADSIKQGEQLYVDVKQTLPLSRFTQPATPTPNTMKSKTKNHGSNSSSRGGGSGMSSRGRGGGNRGGGSSRGRGGFSRGRGR